MANLLCLRIIFCFAFYRFVKIFNILCTCQTNTMSTYIPISRFTWTRIVRRIQNHIIYIDCLFQMDAYCMSEFFDFRVFQNFVIYIDFHTDVYSTLSRIPGRNGSKLNFVPEQFTVKTIMTNNNNNCRFKHNIQILYYKIRLTHNIVLPIIITRH